MMSFLVADDPSVASGNVATSKAGVKKGKKLRKSSSELLAEVMEIVADFGGDAVGSIVQEFLDNLNHTSSMLKSLAREDVIESINFLLRSAISTLGDAAHTVSKGNESSDTVQSSDFGEFLEHYKSALLKKCRGKANFSPMILPQLETVLPLLLQSLSEMYGNVISSMGFGLTFGMLSQGTSLLTMLERPEYVSKDTFKSFADFPTEMKRQFETVVDELINNYVDPSQLEMMIGMARMYASSFASRRGEHDEL
jgi:hypothetical protein